VATIEDIHDGHTNGPKHDRDLVLNSKHAEDVNIADMMVVLDRLSVMSRRTGPRDWRC